MSAGLKNILMLFVLFCGSSLVAGDKIAGSGTGVTAQSGIRLEPIKLVSDGCFGGRRSPAVPGAARAFSPLPADFFSNNNPFACVAAFNQTACQLAAMRSARSKTPVTEVPVIEIQDGR